MIKWQANEVSYKEGKNVDEALNELYNVKNENGTRINNEDLYITKKGIYRAYLSVAYGANDGNYAGWGDLFVNDIKVASSYFDRVASTNTNAITYEIEVNENVEKKIEYKVISNRTLAAGNFSITVALGIVKIQ